MIAAARPLATATAALLGAGVIAAAPALTTSAPAVPRFTAPDIALTSSIFDILTFPAWQQAIANEVEFLAIRTAGLAQGGAGFAESAAQLPETLLTAAQQVFSGNALDALTTVEEWAFDAGSATLIPPIAANIEVGQIQLAIQSALLAAQPLAAVELGAGLFTAFDDVTRSFIIAGQNIVDAILSFDIGGVVQAVITGVTGVISAFGAGGQAIVDGIVSAQNTLAAALATRPILIPPIGPTSAAPKIAAAESAAATVTVPAPAADVTESPRAAVDAVPAHTERTPTVDVVPNAGEPAGSDIRATADATPQRGSSALRTGRAEQAHGTAGDAASKADGRRGASR